MVKFRKQGFYYTLPSGRRQLFRWVYLLPALLAVISLLAGLLTHWLGKSSLHRLMLTGDLGPDGRKLARSLFWNYSKTELERTLFSPDGAVLPSQLEQAWLFLSQDDIDDMLRFEQEHLLDPNPDRERYTGFFRRGAEDDFLEVDVSIRGASDWHHRPNKPSFRLRFSKRRRSPGYRWLEMQRPEDVLAIANWYPDALGKELLVPNGRSHHARVHLNRKPLGVYALNYRPGDRLALANGLLPAVFFKGDKLEADSIWTVPEDWTVEGDLSEADRRWFAEFLNIVGEGTVNHQTRRRLGEYLDEDVYARWMAIAVFSGSSHADDHHNQMFYLNSYQGKLQPVIWDFNALGILQIPDTPVNTIASHLSGLILQDPRFVYQRDLWLHKLVNEDSYTQLLWDHVEELLPDLLSDRALIQLENVVPFSDDWSRWSESMHGRIYPTERSRSDIADSLKETDRWLSARKNFLKAYLDDAEVTLQPGQQGGSRLAVGGHVAVKAFHRDGREWLLYPGLEFMGKDQKLPAPIPWLDKAPLFYDLPASPDDLTFANAITGEALQPGTRWPQPAEKLMSLNPGPTPAQPKIETLSLGPGDVSLTQDVVVDEKTHLVVKPGTTLKLAPGVSLFSRGRVTMEGTPKEPIRIQRADPEKAYGCVGLVGKATASSSFAHVEATGGSVGRLGAVVFKGMFNVYDCPQLSLRHCRFSENTVGDDVVNLALSRVVLENCEFSQALMDALDLDACRGEINDCLFQDSGNDGLDIMESSLEVNDCRFLRCGDKGVSIGEECATTITGGRWSECVTGVELKDASRTRIVEGELRDCQTAVRAYRKKWLLRVGGAGELVNTRVVDCIEDLDLDLHSRVWLRDTDLRVDPLDEPRVFRSGEFSLGEGPSVRLP